MMVFKGKEKGYSKSIHNKLEIPILEGGGVGNKMEVSAMSGRVLHRFLPRYGYSLEYSKKKS